MLFNIHVLFVIYFFNQEMKIGNLGNVMQFDVSFDMARQGVTNTLALNKMVMYT